MDPRDMAAYMAGLLRGQSHAEIIGPIADAGGENGLVLRAGEVVDECPDSHIALRTLDPRAPMV